jgi:MerR family transcriptional regulator/heat shock protein HspR
MKEYDDRPVFIISVAAELSSMHPQTLRIYERKGLLRPKRSKGKSRLYSEKDIAQLKEIQILTQGIGINLAGVKKIFNMKKELESAEKRLDTAKRELDNIKEQSRREILEILRANSPQIVLSQSRSITRIVGRSIKFEDDE